MTGYGPPRIIAQRIEQYHDDRREHQDHAIAVSMIGGRQHDRRYRERCDIEIGKKRSGIEDSERQFGQQPACQHAPCDSGGMVTVVITLEREQGEHKITGTAYPTCSIWIAVSPIGGQKQQERTHEYDKILGLHGSMMVDSEMLHQFKP